MGQRIVCNRAVRQLMLLGGKLGQESGLKLPRVWPELSKHDVMSGVILQAGFLFFSLILFLSPTTILYRIPSSPPPSHFYNPILLLGGIPNMVDLAKT